MKTCSNCKIEKSLDEFHIDSKGRFGRKSRCKDCLNKRAIDWYHQNSDRINADKREKYIENREYYIERVNLWRENNREKVIEYNKQYNKQRYQDNREQYNEYKRDWQKNKRNSDSLYKLKCTLRTRTSMAFRRKSWKKNTKTQEMLGGEWITVKSHIESRFKEGMSWDNFGEWQIDHIIPLASAKTEKDLIELCHYTNLQPLWAEENLIKGNKITACRINLNQ
jgi:hypothetical protein